MQVLSEMIRKHCLTSYLAAWLVCISLRVVVADLARYCNSNSGPVSGGACGDHLTIVLNAVCRSGYAGYYKRSVPDNLHAVVRAHDADDSEMFLPKRHARSFLDGGSFKSKRSMFQGVVCECCYNRCSLPEMTEYCKDPSIVQMNKKSLYQPVPAPYARVAAARMAELQKSRTVHAADSAESFETSGDSDTGAGHGDTPMDAVAAENKELRENIYLRSLLAKAPFPEAP